MLTPVATIVSQLRALKPFPDQQIVVTAIAGPRDAVHGRVEEPTDEPTRDRGRRSRRPACAADGSLGLPPSASRSGLRPSAPNGLFLSACQDNFGPSLDRMAMLLNQAMSPR